MVQEDQQNKRRRLPRWIIISAAVMLLLICGYVGWRVSLRAAIQRELQAIRDAGYPVTLDEAEAWYPMLTGENAAEIYASVEVDGAPPGVDLDQVPYLGGSRWRPGDAWTPEMEQAVEGVLNANTEQIEKLHQAAKIEAAHYAVDRSTGLLPQLRGLRTQVNLLVVQAQHRAHGGELDAAIGSVSAAAGIARSLRDEPTMVSRLVYISCAALANNAIRGFVGHEQPTDAQLIRMMEILRSVHYPQGTARACVGELIYANHTLEELDWEEMYPPYFKYIEGWGGPSKWWRTVYPWLGLAELDHLVILRLEKEAIDAVKLPESQRLTSIRHIMTKADSYPDWRFLIHDMLRAYDRFLELDLRCSGDIECTKAGIAAERYRLAHGQWPENLAGLVPEYLEAVPIDPFTGNSLIYKLTDTGILIYSTSDDGIDNGGAKTNAEGREYESGADMPFEINRP